MERALGVYRATAQGLEPLYQAALGTYRQSFEIEERSGQDRVPGYSLQLRRPEAFAEPQQILVDALWYQPYFATPAGAGGGLSARSRGSGFGLSAARRDVGIDGLSAAAGTGASALSAVAEDEAGVAKEDLLDLLAMFGSLDGGPYHKLPQLIGTLSVSVVPDGTLQGAGIRHVYTIEVKAADARRASASGSFIEQLTKILDAWDYEARVEVRTNPEVQLAQSSRASTSPRRDP